MNFIIKIKLLLWKLFHFEDVQDAKNVVFYIFQNKALPEPLESDDEAVLLEEVKAGSRTARDKLIEHNLRLVVYIAKQGFE